jgi:hypothetical protein
MSLPFLQSVAVEFGATLKAVGGDRMEVELRVPRPGGRFEAFSLIIENSQNGPKVRETEPRRLPASCLERHINYDGSFCLGWSSGGNGTISDEAQARVFWTNLEKFLNSQLAASKTGRWPGQQNARAHGAAAAPQDRAENICAHLGAHMLRDLKRGKLTAEVDRRWHKERLTLLRDGLPIARTKKNKKAPFWVAKVCPCGTSPSPATKCSDHAGLLAALSNDILQWRTEHQAYVYSAVRDGQRCCGTMERCELRDAQKARSRAIRRD